VTGIGEGALLEAEQLGLEESFRNRGAVDRDERSSRPGPGFMDSPGKQALACPGLTENKNRWKAACLRVAAEELLGLSPHSFDSRAITD